MTEVMLNQNPMGMSPDRGKGVSSFGEMMDFTLVEVDFDDPTTNVRGRLIEARVSRSFDEMITIDLVESTLTIRLQTCTTLRLSNR